MKRFIFVIILVFSVKSHSQKLHGFIFCKTNDKNPTMQKGTMKDYVMMRDYCQILAKTLKYKYEDHSLMGIDFTHENIIDLLENITYSQAIKPTDLIVVYYSTHGKNIRTVNDLFPAIDAPDTWIQASLIHNKLLKLNPKFIISIIDACNTIKQNSKQETFLLEAKDLQYRVTTTTIPAVNPKINDLFNRCQDVIICASNPGTKAIQTDDGSIFTKQFLRAFKEITTSKSNTITWEQIFERTKSYTTSFTTAYHYDSYPIWSPAKCFQTVSKSIDSMPVKTEANFIVDVKREKKGFLKKIFSKNQWYNVSLLVTGSKKIDSVSFFLHHTFRDSIVNINGSLNNIFKYKIKVWGEFPVKATVYYADGDIEDVYDGINFDYISTKSKDDEYEVGYSN